MSQNKETAALLVSQVKPLGIALYLRSTKNAFIMQSKSTFLDYVFGSLEKLFRTNDVIAIDHVHCFYSRFISRVGVLALFIYAWSSEVRRLTQQANLINLGRHKLLSTTHVKYGV